MGIGWQRATVAACTAVLALLALMACGASREAMPPVVAPQEPPDTAAGPQRTGPESPPGTLLDARAVADPHPSLARIGARMWQMRYASRSGLDDAPVEVTGVVIEPAGSPPAGGWPVVSYAHATTGLADACAPSRSSNLLGQLTVVLPLVARGYLVTASDYEGLGTPGPHPYLQPVSEGRGVIDVVRAARMLVPAASQRWVALGISQGGQGAWAAGELAGEWGRGLDHLGAAALAPPTDIGSLADDVPDDLSTLQQAFYPGVLASLKLRHPELDFADYLSGGALAALPAVLDSCDSLDFASFPAADLTPRSPEVLEQARAWLDELALPSRPAAGPLFVAAGTVDALVPVDTVDVAVEQACAFGGAVEYRRYPGAGHPALPAAATDTLRWIADRFAGLPAPSTCGIGTA